MGARLLFLCCQRPSGADWRRGAAADLSIAGHRKFGSDGGGRRSTSDGRYDRGWVSSGFWLSFGSA